MGHMLQNKKKREIIKQKIYRLQFYNHEHMRVLLKVILKTNYVEKQYKALAALYIASIPLKASITKHKNICLKTGKKRSVNKFTKLSRLSMREEAGKLRLPGIKIANW